MELFIRIFELVGTVAFAISGSLVAIDKEMDLLGVMILGAVTAFGGGMTRDIILGITPPIAFTNAGMMMIALGSGLCTFLAVYIYNWRLSGKGTFHFLNRLMFLSDTVGLGVFTVIGVQTAMEKSEVTNFLLLVFVGVATGVGGGVIRDLFAGSIPSIFRKHIYACASILGAFLCSCLWEVTGKGPAILLGFFAVVIVRVLASRYRWNLPKVRIKKEEK